MTDPETASLERLVREVVEGINGFFFLVDESRSPDEVARQHAVQGLWGALSICAWWSEAIRNGAELLPAIEKRLHHVGLLTATSIGRFHATTAIGVLCRVCECWVDPDERYRLKKGPTLSVDDLKGLEMCARVEVGRLSDAEHAQQGATKPKRGSLDIEHDRWCVMIRKELKKGGPLKLKTLVARCGGEQHRTTIKGRLSAMEGTMVAKTGDRGFWRFLSDKPTR